MFRYRSSARVHTPLRLLASGSPGPSAYSNASLRHVRSSPPRCRYLAQGSDTRRESIMTTPASPSVRTYGRNSWLCTDHKPRSDVRQAAVGGSRDCLFPAEREKRIEGMQSADWSTKPAPRSSQSVCRFLRFAGGARISKLTVRLRRLSERLVVPHTYKCDVF